MFVTEERGDERAHDQVRALAGAWAFPCDDSQIGALSGYADLLLRWNARINLTAARSIGVVVSEHFPDAFALARRIDRARVIDIGSGGGLPAIPLAVLRPGITVELVEPIAKKAAFLRTAIRELDMGERVSVRIARGEAVAKALAADRSAAFDVAISRATLAPAKWLALGVQLVRPGGRVFALAAAGDLTDQPDREVYFDGRRALVQVVAP